MFERNNNDPGSENTAGNDSVPEMESANKKTEKKTYKIDKETAEAEFASFCEANDIDCDVDGMTDDDQEDFKPIKRRFINACREGRVVVDGRKIIYTVSEYSAKEFQGTVEIKRPDGHAFIAMDGYKETQSVHKLQGFVASMAGKEVKYFSKLDVSDWLFFRDMATLFLSV
jgi:hypothetical protein